MDIVKMRESYLKYKTYLDYQSNEIIKESDLENSLIYFLVNEQGYSYNEKLHSEEKLKENFKNHLERLNNTKIEDVVFNRIWDNLNGNDFITKHKSLIFDKETVYEDNDPKKDSKNIKYFDFDNIENNSFEIINQLWTDSKKSRFDVNILINGIPTVHIELKRSDVSVDDALKQFVNYKKVNEVKGFLDMSKLFVSTNGFRTKYSANVESTSRINIDKFCNQQFYWTDSDEKNTEFHKMLKFAEHFFEKEFLIDLIKNGFVYGKKDIKVLRPYQYHAVKKISDDLNNQSLSNREKSGYVWHATGSGKTITSFMLANIALQNENIDKVIFMVDRLDLVNTAHNTFEQYSHIKNYELIRHTSNLIKSLANGDKKILITSQQKFINFFNKILNDNRCEIIKQKRILFIVDECHRSQDGNVRKNLENFFVNSINIAFTGTPIFNENNFFYERTTPEIFGKRIHKYTMREALRDGNVLEMNCSYPDIFFSEITTSGAVSDSVDSNKKIENNNVGFDDDLNDDNIEIPFYPKIVDKIARQIDENFNKLTHDKKCNAILATSSIHYAIEYYKKFDEINSPLNKRIVFTTKKDDEYSKTDISKEHWNFYRNAILKHYDDLDIDKDHENLNNYKIRVSDEFKQEDKGIDLLIVVNMFLTGYDSERTNTIFIDKKLRFQNLIQSMSRTNRKWRNFKTNGNVILYQTEEKDVEDACKLFTTGSLTDDDTNINWPSSYEKSKELFRSEINSFKNYYKEPNAFEELFNLSKNDTEKVQNFLSHFRLLKNAYQKVKSLIEFTWDDYNDLMTKLTYDKLFNSYINLLQKVDRKIVDINDDFDVSDLLTNMNIINFELLDDFLKEFEEYVNTLVNTNVESELFEKLKKEILNKISDKNQNMKDLFTKLFESDEFITCKTRGDIVNLLSKTISSLTFELKKKISKKWNTMVEKVDQIVNLFDKKDNNVKYDEIRTMIGENSLEYLNCDVLNYEEMKSEIFISSIIEFKQYKELEKVINNL